LDALKQERDKYKQQCAEMTKFLSDYGLKWVGGEGG
jgi:UBX domain-containing protein 11